MSQYLSHLAALTLNQVQPLQPRLASRFETPVDKNVSGNNDIAVTQESPVSSFAHSQSSPIAATNNPGFVTQKVTTEFNDGQIKKEPSKQDQLKVVEHTEPVIKKYEPPNDEQKLSLSQGFTRIDTEPVSRVTPSIIQPVAQPANTIFPKDTPAKKSTQTPVERMREHFSETTLNELVIREIAAISPDARQKITRLEEPLLSAPVKPTSITVPSEPSTVGSNTASQKTGLFEESSRPAPVKPSDIVVATAVVNPPSQANTEQISPQKIHNDEELPRSVPVKPGSIIVRTEQATVESNTLSQSGIQQTPATQFDIDTPPVPTIQVTIGRIEIRATQVSDKSATKPRAASTTMSLDDYLKQRNGGRA